MKETRQRILDAATRVFGRDGVSGATTREIARSARVNEVTLFRNFHNKAELLRCVIAENSDYYDDVFAEAKLETAADVRRTVTAYAGVFARKLLDKEDFVRTFIGELARHPKLCERLFVDSIRPVRQKFIDYLRSAQKSGLVRRELDTVTAADALTGMLLADVMRRPLSVYHYTPQAYFKTGVAIFLKGIEP